MANSSATRRLPRHPAYFLGLMMSCVVAQAADISVLGLFPGKALLVVNGAPPKTYSVGDTVDDNTRLVAADKNGAAFDEGGRRSTVALGQYVGTGSGGQGSVTLSAGEGGHFIATGQINGGSVRMMVDTGATQIAMPASEAQRLGIHYRKGRLTSVNTANGSVPAYRIQLDTVRVGDLLLYQVDALVQESGLSLILLGNSFLNRCDMKRDGQQMTLTKRF